MNFFRLVLGLALLPPAAFAKEGEDSDRRLVSVSGTCVRAATPDRGALVVTIDVQGKDLSAITKDATQTYEKLREEVKKLKLENFNLSTSEYSVQDVHEWENNKNVFKGYRARMGMRVVTSSIHRLGEVIALSGKYKVRDVGSLQTFLSEKKRLDEQLACLEEAARNAEARAEKLAASLDAKVGPVHSISENWASDENPRPSPVYNMRMAKTEMASDAGGAPAVEAGEQTLRVTVQVSFTLR